MDLDKYSEKNYSMCQIFLSTQKWHWTLNPTGTQTYIIFGFKNFGYFLLNPNSLVQTNIV